MEKLTETQPLLSCRNFLLQATRNLRASQNKVTDGKSAGVSLRLVASAALEKHSEPEVRHSLQSLIDDGTVLVTASIKTYRSLLVVPIKNIPFDVSLCGRFWTLDAHQKEFLGANDGICFLMRIYIRSDGLPKTIVNLEQTAHGRHKARLRRMAI